MTSTTNQYVPNPTAVPNDELSTALLSSRDLSLAIPINFATHAGVSFSTCFPQNRYEDGAARKCLSNLLATGFRRVVIDVYWDPSRSAWSLCPVMLGSATPADPSTTSATSPTATSESSLSSASLSMGFKARFEQTVDLFATNTPLLSVRQASSTTASDTTRSVAVTSSANNKPTIIATSPETLYQVGSYQCTSSVDLGFVGDIFSDYFSATGFNTNATVSYMVLNLHVAANPNGDDSTIQNSDLPSPGNYVADVLNSTLFSYLYTPEVLQNERANLNASWFRSDVGFQPDHAYLDLEHLPSGVLSTSGGWPSEGYLEFYKYKRLLIGYGSVDAQISGYNVSNDGQTIFAPGQLTNQDTIVSTSPATISSGCFFDPNGTSVSSTNNSWAQAENVFGTSYQADIHTLLYESSNVTACGVSPLLNQTLLNATAETNSTSYTDFVLSTIWSWYRGQPNDTGLFNSSNNPSTGEHCAVVNLVTSGKWHATSCNDQHYAACRIGSQPYLWTVSEQSGAYDAVQRVCPDNSSFAVPRTALENAYLVSAIQSAHNSGHLDPDETSLWVNFNDLDVSGCWVSGTNSTCPYVQRTVNMSRKVTVPTVAAVVVFVIAGLTILVKCAANRGASKRRRNGRRRGDGGWDYEGVPS